MSILEPTTPLVSPTLTGDVVTPKADQPRTRGFDFMAAAAVAAVTPADELVALLAEHGAQMFVGDLGEGVTGWAARVHGRITLIFPEGQDPTITLDVARTQIARLEADAQPGTGHFPWCAPGACRTHHNGDATWTEHEGAPNGLPNRARIPDHTEPLLASSLYHCADFGDNPQISVDFRGEGTTFTAAEADLLIADFEEFLTQLKAQRAALDQKPADE